MSRPYPGNRSSSRLSSVGEWIGSEREVRESICALATGEGGFFLGARQNAETNKLRSVLVAETELGGRSVFEIEVDPLHPVVDPPADSCGGHIVSIRRLTSLPFRLG